MAGYDGLALAMYDKNAQSFTNQSGDFFSITVTDASTYAAAMRGVFVKEILKGTYDGYWVSAFESEISFGGTIADEISGFAAYFSETGTATMTGSIVNGFQVYFEAIGSAADYRAGFHCYSAETATYIGSAMDAGILIESAGSTGTWGALIGGMGITPPKYFLHWKDQASTVNFVQEGPSSTSAAAGLRVKIYNTCYSIPLIASTSAS